MDALVERMSDSPRQFPAVFKNRRTFFAATDLSDMEAPPSLGRTLHRKFNSEL